MPLYPFLFESRKIVSVPAPDALVLFGPAAPPAGYEVIPKPEAQALVAYLLSLRSDASLFSAPLASGTPPSGGGDTNSTAAPGVPAKAATPQ